MDRFWMSVNAISIFFQVNLKSKITCTVCVTWSLNWSFHWPCFELVKLVRNEGAAGKERENANKFVRDWGKGNYVPEETNSAIACIFFNVSCTSSWSGWMYLAIE